jgi:uncharacterized protein
VTNILSRDNRLFALARQGKRQASALQAVAVVIGIVTLMIAAQVVGRVIVRLIHLTDMQSDAGSIVEGVSGFLAVCTGLGIWLRLWSKRSLRTLGFENRHTARHIFTGTLVALLMIASAIGLEIIPGASFSRQEIGRSGIALLSTGFLNLLSATLHASAEEAVFRGWLLPSIGSRYGPGIGIAVSALLFSVLHATNVVGHSDVAPLAFLNLLLFGAFAAIYALAEGGLWGSVRGMRCGIGYKVICLGFLSAAVFIPAFWSRSRQVVRPF